LCGTSGSTSNNLSNVTKEISKAKETTVLKDSTVEKDTSTSKTTTASAGSVPLNTPTSKKATASTDTAQHYKLIMRLEGVGEVRLHLY
jgi:hypothetical protein